ncbi:unnamed protein product [Durusdinium trenchii]|uniref:Telomere length regulation protein TEL2 homolog n=1 Tax=Durusdinium trenchii TaxID=1381693 RepID=A0ABP0JXQ7_9DINO
MDVDPAALEALAAVVLGDQDLNGCVPDAAWDCLGALLDFAAAPAQEASPDPNGDGQLERDGQPLTPERASRVLDALEKACSTWEWMIMCSSAVSYRQLTTLRGKCLLFRLLERCIHRSCANTAQLADEQARARELKKLGRVAKDVVWMAKGCFQWQSLAKTSDELAANAVTALSSCLLPLAVLLQGSGAALGRPMWDYLMDDMWAGLLHGRDTWLAMPETLNPVRALAATLDLTVLELVGLSDQQRLYNTERRAAVAPSWKAEFENEFGPDHGVQASNDPFLQVPEWKLDGGLSLLAFATLCVDQPADSSLAFGYADLTPGTKARVVSRLASSLLVKRSSQRVANRGVQLIQAMCVMVPKSSLEGDAAEISLVVSLSHYMAAHPVAQARKGAAHAMRQVVDLFTPAARAVVLSMAFQQVPFPAVRAILVDQWRRHLGIGGGSGDLVSAHVDFVHAAVVSITGDLQTLETNLDVAQALASFLRLVLAREKPPADQEARLREAHASLSSGAQELEAQLSNSLALLLPNQAPDSDHSHDPAKPRHHHHHHHHPHGATAASQQQSSNQPHDADDDDQPFRAAPLPDLEDPHTRAGILREAHVKAQMLAFALAAPDFL